MASRSLLPKVAVASKLRKVGLHSSSSSSSSSSLSYQKQHVTNCKRVISNSATAVAATTATNTSSTCCNCDSANGNIPVAQIAMAAAVTALGATWIQNEQNKKESSSISNNKNNIENPLLDNILRLNPPSIIPRFINADNKIFTTTLTTITSCDGGIMPSKRNNTGPRRNVMLHRKRSVRARHLDDKYIVDWSTVMGEGAYGSVHPARLRQTGQKVREAILCRFILYV